MEEAAEVGVGLGTAFPHRAPYQQCAASRVPRGYGYVLAVSAALAAEPPVERNRQVWIVRTWNTAGCIVATEATHENEVAGRTG